VEQLPTAPAAVPFMSCSDCRAPMRDRYYSISERPICGKCRPKYARSIARTDGPGAIWRVGLQGALVAIAGVVALVAVITVWPPAGIFLLVPIGYLVGKRMMASLDGYSNRRYQYLAVALTYLCFVVGFTVTAVNAERDTRNRRAEIRAKMQPRTLATQGDALREEIAALNAGQGNPDATVSGGDPRPDEQAAAAQAKAASDDVGRRPGLAIVFLLLSPVLSMMQFGIMFSAVGLMVLGYALLQAWRQTDGQGMSLDLSGPYPVGQGPIQAR